MAAPPAKLLLVEGAKDRRVIPYLAEACGVASPPVHITDLDGIENLLEPGYVEVEFKVPKRVALGVLVDADDGATEQWRKVRDRLRAVVPTVPDDLPEDGLVVAPPLGPCVGAWVMPDNRLAGTLEAFLAHLVPDHATNHLWQFAGAEAIDRARSLGGTWKDVQRSKAAMHSWLAWHDEPGRQLHEAIKHKLLKPGSPIVDRFMAWFHALFEV